MYYILILALTQQSMETCDGLDTLISNSIMAAAGNCTRNDDCNQVTCMGEETPSITVTFPATPTSPCSIRNQVSIPSLLNLDETITENRDLIVQGLIINLNVNFSPAGNVSTVRYGVS